jgi:branched-chain amino acid transport system substrate-binding protein
MFGDPQHYPWTMAVSPPYQTAAHIFAKHIVETKPNAKIGLLYQNDDLGKDYLVGLHNGLGDDHAAMIIKEASYEVSEPTVDSQVVTLQGAGTDTLIIAATPKAAAQTIRKAYDIDWMPARYISYTASSIATVLKPAGLDKSKGLITSQFTKDPTDSRWRDDPGCKEWAAFGAKYLTPSDRTDFNAIVGFSIAAMLIQILRQCGDGLSRENIMRQATNLKDLELPMLLPGIKVNTSPDNFYPIRQMQLAAFNGESWQLFGDVMSG